MTLHGTFELGTYSTDGNNNKTFTSTFTKNIVSYEMITARNDDDRNPTTQPKVDYIEVKLVSNEKLYEIADWYLHNTMLQGRITVQLEPQHSSATVNRTIEFTDAYCFSFLEEFELDTSLRITTIQIVPKEITVDSITI